MNVADRDLVSVLRKWRSETWEKEHPEYKGTLLVPQTLMSDRVLERLVALAHTNSLPSIDQLARDLNWCHTAKYGNELLGIMCKSVPAQPTISNPPSRPPGKQQRKCSYCSTAGHNSEQIDPINTVVKH